MQRVILLCVGPVKTSWMKDGCAEYEKRLKASFQLEVRELPASKQKDPEKFLQEESKRLLETLAKLQGDVFVLDERGEGKTSLEFAALVSKSRDRGVPLVFVLGGAYGFTDEFRSRAGRLLRLSDMTFPHELCRVVFLEQLYRASQILGGGKYHH